MNTSHISKLSLLKAEVSTIDKVPGDLAPTFDITGNLEDVPTPENEFG